MSAENGTVSEGAAVRQGGALAANISMLFTEVPLPERFAAAARAGFDAVEIQFPYGVPPDTLRRAAGELPVVLINAPATDARGANGLATDPAGRAAFAAGLDEALRYAEALGAAKLNVLAGPPPPGQPDAVTRAVLADNVRLAAERFRGTGVALVMEAINPVDLPGFWLDGLGKALAFLDGLGETIGFQFDLYHMARTEPDLLAAIAAAGARIGHVQFADLPGRHEPGTGGIDFPAALAALAEAGYAGALAAEYRPLGRTEEGLGWMPMVRACMAAGLASNAKP